MSEGTRIPTPLKHRLRRIRYNVMPVVCFAVCAVLTVWMWHDRGSDAHMTAEAEAVRIEVTAAADGLLVPLPMDTNRAGGFFDRFDRVRQNELIAMLDDANVRNGLGMVRAEIDRLQAQLVSDKARALFDQATLQADWTREQQNNAQELLQLATQVEQYHLDVLDRKAEIAIAEVEKAGHVTQLAFWEKLKEKGSEAFIESEYKLIENQIEVATEEIAKSTEALELAQNQFEDADRRHKSKLAEIADGQDTRDRAVLAIADTVAAPIQAEIGKQAYEIENLKLQGKDLEIRAPIDGTICAVYRRPGEYVRAGDPIVAIGSDLATTAVAWVKTEYGVELAVDTKVEVRKRVSGSRFKSDERTVVLRLGAQVEPLPDHVLANPQVPEWGRPMRVNLPMGFNVSPGELIDIRFPRQ